MAGAGLAGIARRAGAWRLVIDPQPGDPCASGHAVIAGTAATLLPALLNCV